MILSLCDFGRTVNKDAMCSLGQIVGMEQGKPYGPSYPDFSGGDSRSENS